MRAQTSFRLLAITGLMVACSDELQQPQEGDAYPQAIAQSHLSESEQSEVDLIEAIHDRGISSVETLELNGSEPLFWETRYSPGGAAGPERSADVLVRRDRRLENVGMDPTDIPVLPLSRQLGQDVSSVVRIQGGADGSVWRDRALVARSTELVAGSEDPPAGEAESARVPDVPVPPLRERVRNELEAMELDLSASERVSADILFWPVMEVDTEHRVDWLSSRQFRTAREALMDAEIRLRAPVVEAATARSLEWVMNETDCTVVNVMPITNAATLECSSRDLLRLAEFEGEQVAAIRVASPPTIPADSGLEFRSIAPVGSQMGLAEDHGYNGEGPSGATSSDNVRIGLVDVQGFYGVELLPAYYDNVQAGVACGEDFTSVPSMTRIVGRYECNPSGCYTGDFSCDATGCTPGVSWGSGPGNHGARTMASFQDILQHQDPCSTSDSDEQNRSFGASEASINVYHNVQHGGWMQAIYHAVNDGVHALSASQMSDSRTCDNPRSTDPWFAIYTDYALSHQMSLVVSASNYVRVCEDDCLHANEAGHRPEIVVVGAVGDQDPSEDFDSAQLMGGHDMNTSTRMVNMHNSPNITYPSIPGLCAMSCTLDSDCPDVYPYGDEFCNEYGRCDVGTWSTGMGGADMRVYGARQDGVRGVIDVVAPENHHGAAIMYLSGTNTSWSYVPKTGSGTSHAAPHVAAQLAVMIDWALVEDEPMALVPGVLNAMLLATADGDRRGATHSHDYSSPASSSGMDPLWGAGRAHLRLPTEAAMDGPWEFLFGSSSVSPGLTWVHEIGYVQPGTDHHMVVATVNDERNLDANSSISASRYWVKVFSTERVGTSCSPSGTRQYHASDYSYDTQHLIRMGEDLMLGLQGRCAYLEFTASVYAERDQAVYFAAMLEETERQCYEQLGECGIGCSGPVGCVE